MKEQTKSDVTHSSNTGHGVVRIPSTTHTPTEQTFEQIPMFVNASTETLRQQQPHHVCIRNFSRITFSLNNEYCLLKLIIILANKTNESNIFTNFWTFTTVATSTTAFETSNNFELRCTTTIAAYLRNTSTRTTANDDNAGYRCIELSFSAAEAKSTFNGHTINGWCWSNTRTTEPITCSTTANSF